MEFLQGYYQTLNPKPYKGTIRVLSGVLQGSTPSPPSMAGLTTRVEGSGARA